MSQLKEHWCIIVCGLSQTDYVSWLPCTTGTVLVGYSTAAVSKTPAPSVQVQDVAKDDCCQSGVEQVVLSSAPPFDSQGFVSTIRHSPFNVMQCIRADVLLEGSQGFSVCSQLIPCHSHPQLY